MSRAGERSGGQGWRDGLLKELSSLLTILKVRELSILSLERGEQRTDVVVTLKYPLYLPLLHPTCEELGGSSSKAAPPICSPDIT